MHLQCIHTYVTIGMPLTIEVYKLFNGKKCSRKAKNPLKMKINTFITMKYINEEYYRVNISFLSENA